MSWDLFSAAGEEAVRDWRDRLREVAGKLQVLSPLNALARGFAIPISPERRLLRSARAFAPGSAFTLTVAAGSEARIRELRAEGDGFRLEPWDGA
ncbi:MAG TPA: hypothetical protein VHG28_17350 [Longimicrobiaceae bacterium]|nr:hypothetical protein [Longimicrobiaceae bacterium]